MRFAVTFGQRFRHDDHPTFLPAHPDGYVVIDVPGREYLPPRLAAMPGPVEEIAAREAAFELLGSQWAFIYTMDDLNRVQIDGGVDRVDLFPRGQIGLIERQHGHWLFVEPHPAYAFHGDQATDRCWCRIRMPHVLGEQES